MASALLQLVLYLCTQEAEVVPDPDQAAIYQPPRRAIKDKGKEVQIFDCGADCAQQIRDHSEGYEQVLAKSGPWRYFISQREFVLKWMPPTYKEK